MKVEEALKILEDKIAPVELSNEFCAKYNAYDNSGIIINCGNNVSGALFCLDLSELAVCEALRLGYNLIITHHPAIYGGISRIDVTSTPQSRAIEMCIKNGISVISMHLNFDAAPQGIDYYLMKGLGGNDCTICEPLHVGGYGRAYSVPGAHISEFIQKVKDEFNTQRAVYHGDKNLAVSKIASFCGAGCDDHAIAFAKANACNLLVSSDLKHHQIVDLVESGIGVLQLTHYCAESYGLKHIYNNLKESITPSSFFFDDRFA